MEPARKKWLWRSALLLLIAGMVSVPLYVWAAIGITYSSGERVGFVQKISESGWTCKTYKGDLFMGSASGQPGKVFEFNVRDADVAKEIGDLTGHRVVLHYEQHKGVPSTCFGDSEYFVSGVRRLD